VPFLQQKFLPIFLLFGFRKLVNLSKDYFFMLRLFYALPIPSAIRQQLLASFPQKKFAGVRFVAEENLHITLHFLGDVPEEKLQEVISSGKGISHTAPSFCLRFNSLQTIFKERKPVMIWAQFEDSPAFENLCLELRKSFPTDEKRKPLPHLTIARIKQLKKLPFDLPSLNTFSFETDHLELWESHLDLDGAQYKMIESWNLRR
jgi:2'-5' RNA ligase